MTEEFSHRTRAADLARMSRETFDVLVIGGGIVGAGVARDAATRGLATALVERDDFASGTSGTTSRLVHGGLRYLRDGRMGLVRDAVRERDRLVRLAPALVRPLRFVIPVYEGGGLRTWSLRLGLFLYDALSREKAMPRRRWLTPQEVLAEEPALASDGLLGGGMYFDAITDDARLVREVVRDAARSGAAVANHAEAVQLLASDGRAAGARVRDRIGGASYEVRARTVVNATGVWADRLRRRSQGRTVRPTKGIHVLVPRERVGNAEGIVLTAKRDRRVMFVLPWGPLALIGTTDTDYEGDPDRVAADATDVEYLLESVNAKFPNAGLTPRHVVSAYAGLRPLVRSRDAKAKESDVSRGHDVFEDPDGLLTVVGGKLTTHRRMAEEVVDRVCERLGRRLPSRTAERPLGPASAGASQLVSWGFDRDAAERLAARHDPADLRTLLDEPTAAERVREGSPFLWIEVHAAVQTGMAMTLADVLVRRLGAFYDSPDHGTSLAPAVAARMGRLLGWEEERINEEILDLEGLARAHRAFRKGDDA